MRFIHDTEPPTVELSRRNLTALLAKLDDPASVRTMVSPGGPGEPVIVVTAVEDAVHYADRAAGALYMPTAGFSWNQPAVAGHGARLAGLLEDLEAQRYQPDTVMDLVGELREVLGVARDSWIPIDGLDVIDEVDAETQVCGLEQVMTSAAAFAAGWDAPPSMGAFGVVSPRTCESCTIESTVWFRLVVERVDPATLTDADHAVLARIAAEPGSMLVTDDASGAAHG